MADEEEMNEHEALIISQQAERAWNILEDRPLLGTGNEYVPNESDARLIMVLAGTGRSQKRIAGKLGISVTTLVKYYKEVLDDAVELLHEDYDMDLYVMHKKATYNPAYQGSSKWYGANKFGYSDRAQVDNVSTDGSMSPVDQPILVMPDAGMIKNGGVMEEKTSANDGSMPAEFLNEENKNADKNKGDKKDG